MKAVPSLSSLLILLMVFTPSLVAQAPKADLTLEDLYKNSTYPTRYYRSVRWLEDSRHYTTLETNRERACSEIVRYHAKSGERVVLVGADQLVPGDGTIPLELADYQWSADNTKLLLFTNTRQGMALPYPG